MVWFLCIYLVSILLLYCHNRPSVIKFLHNSDYRYQCVPFFLAVMPVINVVLVFVLIVFCIAKILQLEKWWGWCESKFEK